MGELDEIVQEFIAESTENLDRLDEDFVELEKNPGDRDRLASVFRAIHTVKGTCGFLGFSKLEAVAHSGENLLSKLRDGQIKLNVEITNGLLATIDVIRSMLALIEKTGNDGNDPHLDLIELLNKLLHGESAPVSAKLEEPKTVESAPENIPQEQKTQETPPMKSEEEKEKQQVTPVIETQAEDESTPGTGEAQAEAKAGALADNSIRVDVNLLDKLMNLVGELVLTRNQVVQLGARLDDGAFAGALQRLNLITTELQEGVMKTRMQPIGNAWNKFPRVVRDLAKGCGKQVRLVMEGKETEIDKSLIEAIRDPLTHMVRNAVDHGVESPEERMAAGKPVEGTLILRAYHEGGQVIVDIIDDGRGIDRDKVLNKALEKGLVTPAQVKTMTDRDITNLLFIAGFSTAEKVTNVSGRGVGMDVVKTNIEKIGGTIEILSELGKGSTIKVTIPLTLAIVPALIVMSNEERYAVPQISLLELVRLEGDEAVRGIELVSGAPVYRLRGKLLPLVYLRQVLYKEKVSFFEDKNGNRRVNIVVLQANDRQFGLVVDRIEDSQEIVVKPLSNLLHGLTAYAGVTILGDGKAALILDVTDLAHRAGIDSKSSSRDQIDLAQIQAGEESDIHQLLVCSVPGGGSVVIPLSQVTRLEKIKMRSLERVGDRYVVQYRGEIMQLIDVASVLSGGIEHADLSQGAREDDVVDVVVYTLSNHSTGLIVHKIDDIVESRLEIQGETARDGVISTAVVQDKIMEVLDVNKVIRLANPKVH